MKKSAQISGLPIISIMDGNQVGKVKSLVINPDKGSVDFLTIEHEDFQVSVKAIPFKKVIGIGEYAVTVDSENAIIDLNEIPIANQLVNKKIKINNTKVMTRKGELLGEVIEYLVDDETGHILGMQLIIDHKEAVLSSDSVVTFGKDIIIVKEDATTYLLNTIEELVEGPNTTEGNESIGHNLEDVLEEIGQPQEKIGVPENNNSSTKELHSLKEKQVELLKGKTLTSNILGKDGKVLFYQGRVLSEEDVLKAQGESPSLIVDISMNVEA